MKATTDIRVAVLFGGRSSEYEVSLRSAATVLRGLGDRYQVTLIGIDRKGNWKLYKGDPALIPADRWDQHEYTTPVAALPGDPGCLMTITPSGWMPLPLDVVFPVLHGKNGEDGTVQGMLALCNLPCVGCPTSGSAACMDKMMTHEILDGAGIPTAPWDCVFPDEMEDFDALEARLESKLGYPMFVKPANAGSSVGVTKVAAKEDLAAALTLAFEHDAKAVVETAIVGKEVECAVLGNRTLTVSLPGEVRSAHEVYDYEAKYADIGSETLIPAEIPHDSLETVRTLAAKAYRALCCAGLSRVDFFVRADGSVVLNEVNTLPGFTSISMYPMLMDHVGWPLEKLCDELVRLAL